eukprot:1194658-Prorocentrum_minimum.AAC.3
MSVQFDVIDLTGGDDDVTPAAADEEPAAAPASKRPRVECGDDPRGDNEDVETAVRTEEYPASASEVRQVLAARTKDGIFDVDEKDADEEDAATKPAKLYLVVHSVVSM